MPFRDQRLAFVCVCVCVVLFFILHFVLEGYDTGGGQTGPCSGMFKTARDTHTVLNWSLSVCAS